MNYKEYRCMKIHTYFSAGIFGESIYALENMTGFAFIPEYHKISKEEFDSFDDWKNQKSKVNEVILRPVFCSGYKGYADFDESEVINSTW